MALLVSDLTVNPVDLIMIIGAGDTILSTLFPLT